MQDYKLILLRLQNNFEKIILLSIIFLMPFAYSLNVILSNLLLSYLIYSVMTIYVVYYLGVFLREKDKYFSIMDLLLLMFIIIIIIGIFFDYNYSKSITSSLRLIVLYVIPIVFFYLIIFLKKVDYKDLFYIFLFITLIISIELLYEFLYVGDITWYEKKSFNYVHELTGRELPQLLGFLRQTGLIEHIHATSLFISFGFLICFVKLLFSKRNNLYIWIIFTTIFFVALISSGARVIIIASALFVIYIFFKFYKIRFKRMIITFISMMIVLLMFFLVTYNDNQYFWDVIYIQYLPDTILEFFNVKDSIMQEQNSFLAMTEAKKYAFNDFLFIMDNEQTLYNIFFGFGIGNYLQYNQLMNDDYFFYQFFYQFGILGIIVFTMMSLKTFYIVITEKKMNLYILISFAFVFLTIVSIIHSGILMRKGIWAFFFLNLIILFDYYKKPKKEKK